VFLILLGLNACNATYFCFLCECTGEQRKDRSRLALHQHFAINPDRLSHPHNAENPQQYHGVKHPSFFPFIHMDHVLIDILHLMLRVMDVLIDLLVEEVIEGNSRTDEQAFSFVTDEFRSVGISFHFWSTKYGSSAMRHTSLQGEDKMKRTSCQTENENRASCTSNIFRAKHASKSVNS
jgi:hypothetical protein